MALVPFLVNAFNVGSIRPNSSLRVPLKDLFFLNQAIVPPQGNVYILFIYLLSPVDLFPSFHPFPLLLTIRPSQRDSEGTNQQYPNRWGDGCSILAHNYLQYPSQTPLFCVPLYDERNMEYPILKRALPDIDPDQEGSLVHINKAVVFSLSH